MRRPYPHLLALVLLALLASTACGQASQTPAPTPRQPVVVGSKIDTEGSLLGQMILLALKDKGLPATDKTQFGTTQIVRQAILSGEIDIYPEYTGNGAFFFNETDSDVWKDARKGYDRVKMLDKEKNNIIWLTPAPANNTWAIAVPQSLAAKESMKTLDDFASYVRSGGYVKLAGSEEFVTSPVALPAFEKAYNFTLTQGQLVVLAGGNTAVTEKAAADGTNGVNAAMAYGTDGSLSALGLVVLDDPRGAQPVYEPTAILRGAVFTSYGEIPAILGPIFAGLDLKTLQTLNSRIAIEGQDPAKVAGDYMRSKGFVK